VILVDSSVWIDYFNGTITPQTEKLDGLLGREPLAIGDLMLTEACRASQMNETSTKPGKC